MIKFIDLYNEKGYVFDGLWELNQQNGYIFFVSLNPESEPIVYHGTLTIQLKGSDQPIQIQVDLQ